MGETIRLTASDGHRLAAYRADPKRDSRGGIVVAQEIFGVNSHIRAVCDGFTANGYTALAPALFDRVRRRVELGYDERSIAKGRALREGLDGEWVVRDMAAAVQALNFAGRVGVVGYCWGGSVAWLTACRMNVSCAVGYYGGQIAALRRERPRCAVILHFGKTDASIPLKDVAAVRAAHPEVPVYLYPAGHGFNCGERASYHRASAKLALRRTLAFFRHHLG